MHVWVLTQHGYSSMEPLGIFTTEEAAKEAQQNPYTQESNISAYQVWDDGNAFLNSPDNHYR